MHITFRVIGVVAVGLLIFKLAYDRLTERGRNRNQSAGEVTNQLQEVLVTSHDAKPPIDKLHFARPQQVASSSAIDVRSIEPQLIAFFTGGAITGLNNEEKKKKLMILNKMGTAGAKVLLNDLMKSPSQKSEQESRARIAKVDYLRYRIRFDDEIRSNVTSFLKNPAPDVNDNQLRGMMLAERAELLGGVAALDWDVAAEILQEIKDPLLRELSVYEAYHGLQSAVGKEYALALVRTIIPSFEA